MEEKKMWMLRFGVNVCRVGLHACVALLLNVPLVSCCN